MKLLTRLAALLGTLVLSGVALAGTAFAMLPPDPAGFSDGSTVPAGPPPAAAAPSIVQVVGPSTLQVIGLMLCAAVFASVLTAFVVHRPHLHAAS
ncbi:hypothetical protein AB0E69_03045 [Kribbella sp. NPDC026611]|uniref:hypothetical protein n=1 Tax=Kribbella sp. NPDC026611 TaxID=3154911 RepID=UPI0034049A12